MTLSLRCRDYENIVKYKIFKKIFYSWTRRIQNLNFKIEDFQKFIISEKIHQDQKLYFSKCRPFHYILAGSTLESMPILLNDWDIWDCEIDCRGFDIQKKELQ